VLVLLVGPHRAAHHDDRGELPPVRQRIALVELDPDEVESARAQLVLERRRWLARDVLQDEEARVQGHQRYSGSDGGNRSTSWTSGKKRALSSAIVTRWRSDSGPNELRFATPARIWWSASGEIGLSATPSSSTGGWSNMSSGRRSRYPA